MSNDGPGLILGAAYNEVKEPGIYRVGGQAFRAQSLIDVVSSLNEVARNATLRRHVWFGGRYDIETFIKDFSAAVEGDRRPSDEYLRDRLMYTDLDFWKERNRGYMGPLPHRITVDAHITSKDNLSVRFKPEVLGACGYMIPAREWKGLPLLGSAEIMERPNDEVLFIRGIGHLVHGDYGPDMSAEGDEAASKAFSALCAAVNYAFWLTVQRLRFDFEVHFERVVVKLEKKSDRWEEGECLGLELANVLTDHRGNVEEAFLVASSMTTKTPSDFIDCYEKNGSRKDEPRRGGGWPYGSPGWIYKHLKLGLAYREPRPYPSDEFPC